MNLNNTTSYNNLSGLHNLTLDEILERHCSDALAIDRIITPIWYVIGISGNIVSSKIWLERRMRRNNSSAIYLAALSINDTLFLLLHVLQELKYAWFKRTVDYPVICEAYALVYIVTNYLAPALVLGFTVERFIAVCYPYQKLRFCTTSRALKVTGGLVCGCLLLGAIQPYFWAYDATTMKCEVPAVHEDFWANWSWATEMMFFLAVPVVMLVINILVMLEIRKISWSGQPQGTLNHERFRLNDSHNHSSGRKSPTVTTSQLNRRTTGNSGNTPQRFQSGCVATTNAMLLSVSFYVIFTTLPAAVLYVLAHTFPEGNALMELEEMAEDPAWAKFFTYFYIRKIVDEICLSHYACNIILFAITGKMFRESLATLVRCRVKSLTNKSEQSTKYYTIHRTEDTYEPNILITKL